MAKMAIEIVKKLNGQYPSFKKIIKVWIAERLKEEAGHLQAS